MMDAKITSGLGAKGDLTMEQRAKLSLLAKTRWHFECVKPDGSIRWTEDVDNLVVNEGLDDILDKYFKGSAYTATFSVGLIDEDSATVLAAADTAAGITTDHSGANSWGELTEYTEGVRELIVLGTVSAQSVDNSASKASFSINATVTVHGAFLATATAKLATTGVLYGEAAFTVPRAALSGDTLNVTVTLTSASA